MSTFIARSQSEADRLRASRESLSVMLAEFRKHPRSQWQTLFAELSLALESELSEESKPAPSDVDFKLVTNNGKTVLVAAKWTYADRAVAALEAKPEGLTPAELGAALYGPEDERAPHKARAVVHNLQSKRGTPIHRADDGRWVIRREGAKNGVATR